MTGEWCVDRWSCQISSYSSANDFSGTAMIVPSDANRRALRPSVPEDNMIWV